MKTKNNWKTAYTTLMLALGVVGLAAVPTVSAHDDCEGENPEVTCGNCNDGYAHDHRYTNGDVYCQSDGACSGESGVNWYICIVKHIIEDGELASMV